MSAAEVERVVALGRLGQVRTDASDHAEVWFRWGQDSASMSGFISVSKARELATALLEVADATDEATKAAESAVKL